MEKEQKKQLDFNVVKILTENGILNHLQAGMIADIADAVQGSEFNSMKPYKSFKTDIDSKLAEEIVFEYLTRHNMTNTIQCIVSETNREIVPKLQPSGNIKNNLNIDGNDNYLQLVLNEYFNNMDAVFESYHNDLINRINERIGVTPQPQQRSHKSKKRHHHRSTKGEDSAQGNDDGEFE